MHAIELARAYTLARDIPGATAAAVACGFGLAATPVLDPALPLPGLLGLPLRWAARGTLASTMLDVLAANPAAVAAESTARSLPADPGQAFALGLASRARIDETSQLKADLGGPLSDALSELTATAAAKTDGSADWNQVTGLGRLTDAVTPMLTVHQPPTVAEAAALRAVALALANGPDVDGADLAGILRTVAATVTLAEQRSKGEATVGETIILALA